LGQVDRPSLLSTERRPNTTRLRTSLQGLHRSKTQDPHSRRPHGTAKELEGHSQREGRAGSATLGRDRSRQVRDRTEGGASRGPRDPYRGRGQEPTAAAASSTDGGGERSRLGHGCRSAFRHRSRLFPPKARGGGAVAEEEENGSRGRRASRRQRGGEDAPSEATPFAPVVLKPGGVLTAADSLDEDITIGRAVLGMTCLPRDVEGFPSIRAESNTLFYYHMAKVIPILRRTLRFVKNYCYNLSAPCRRPRKQLARFTTIRSSC
jgi:hypothetical protein